MKKLSLSFLFATLMFASFANASTFFEVDCVKKDFRTYIVSEGNGTDALAYLENATGLSLPIIVRRTVGSDTLTYGKTDGKLPAYSLQVDFANIPEKPTQPLVRTGILYLSGVMQTNLTCTLYRY